MLNVILMIIILMDFYMIIRLVTLMIIKYITVKPF